MGEFSDPFSFLDEGVFFFLFFLGMWEVNRLE